jgi:hypothetical protein
MIDSADHAQCSDGRNAERRVAGGADARRRGMTRSFEAAARRIGRYCWIEMRAFETLGAWSGSVPEPDVAATLATHSRQHGWHAELWHDLLPVIGEAPGPSGPPPSAKSGERGVEADRYIEAPSAGWGAVTDALAEPAAPEQTIEKLVGAYRVLLPRTVTAYRGHLATASPLSDGPTIRALELVLSDQVRHWHDGEALVQAQLRSDVEVERAATHQARLESLLVRAGGMTGPDGPAL